MARCPFENSTTKAHKLLDTLDQIILSYWASWEQ